MKSKKNFFITDYFFVQINMRWLVKDVQARTFRKRQTNKLVTQKKPRKTKI